MIANRNIGTELSKKNPVERLLHEQDEQEKLNEIASDLIVDSQNDFKKALKRLINRVIAKN